MGRVRIGPFVLVDPPDDQIDYIKASIDLMNYPWVRLEAALKHDPDGAVLVKWGNTGQGVSGLFYGHTYEIHMSTTAYHVDAGVAFVFAHEVGHLVDRATFDATTKQKFTALFHDGDFIQIGHYDHDHPDAGHTGGEKWSTSEAYTSRINECYADQFVQAFAPSIWDGSWHPDAPQRYPRFIHHTDDHEAVRRLTLERIMTDRIAGTTRFGTAVEVSKVRFPDGAESVYLVNSHEFADAISAGTLATDGPMLLVPATGSVPTEVLAEVMRLKPQRVVAVGGENAVSSNTLVACQRAAQQ